MPTIDQNLISKGVNKLIQEELRYDKASLADEHIELISSFTHEHKGVYDEIKNVVLSNNRGAQENFLTWKHKGKVVAYGSCVTLLLAIQIINQNNQFIHATIRASLCQQLSCEMVNITTPLMIVGDFNIICNLADRQGGFGNLNPNSMDFGNWIHQHNLIYMGGLRLLGLEDQRWRNLFKRDCTRSSSMQQ
ncbi:LOW QUALITY PROTEIN: hypothetical protein V2J09_009658 [Rumex salicifolius]